MPKIEERIVITSGADLQHHFDSILPSLELTETEDSWQKIEKSLIKLEVITKSGGYKHESFSTLFKSVAQPVINSLLSERTKLSGTAADLLNSVAPRLGERFESLIHVFAPTLLLICARTNKVALVRAKKCLLLIAKHCKLPSLLTHLRDASKDKSQTMRMVSVEVTLMLLEAVDSKEKIGRRVADIETIVRGTATDRDPEVRQWCKRVFEVYVDWWPERVTLFTSSFTPTTRRYLALPKTSLSASTNAAPLKPFASSIKRTAPIESHQPRAAAPILKASLPRNTSKEHASTSNAPSSAFNGNANTFNGARSQVNRVQSTPSSSSASSSQGTQSVINITEAKVPSVESEDDKRRAVLRAEILKQVTGTPSQSIAARLALQQLDFQFKKSQKQKEAQDSEEQEEGIKRQTDRALFNIAMAKKKQSPTKGPSRIIVTAPPSTSQKTTANETSRKSAQRILSTGSSTTSSAKGKKAEIQEEEPDVFRSRPIEKVIPSKMTSSISRGMSAREKLLKTSSPMVNRGMKSVGGSRGLHTNKRILNAALKVDIGKENIPPNSGLASIALAATPLLSRDRIEPSRLIAGTIAVELKKTIKPSPVVEEVQEQVRVQDVVAPQEQREHHENLHIEEASVVKEDSLPLKEEEELDTPVLTRDEPLLAANDEEPQTSSAPAATESALHDWSEVAANLPSEQQQEDISPHSAPAHHNDSPPEKAVIAPFMSTPARRTLNEININVSPFSLSSPLCGNVQHIPKVAASLSTHSPLHLSIKKEAPKPKTLILAASRKM